jgi:hypothetical protein
VLFIPFPRIEERRGSQRLQRLPRRPALAHPLDDLERPAADARGLRAAPVLVVLPVQTNSVPVISIPAIGLTLRRQGFQEWPNLSQERLAAPKLLLDIGLVELGEGGVVTR